MKRTLVFLALFSIFLLPTSFVFSLWSGKTGLETTHSSLLSGNFSQAQVSAENSYRHFQKAANYFFLLPFLEKIPKINDAIEIGQGLAEISLRLARAGESAEQMVKIVLRNESGNLTKLTQEVEAEIDLSLKKLSLIESQFKKRSSLKIPEIRTQLEAARDLVSLAPELLAASQRRSYLVLLQNNMELRATGGFIGSYAVVIFENGQLLDFQVEDVYTADGQLRGHVEPPEPIKKYLGEAGWYLRDSNFDPDFPKSAQKAAWFFQKETGRVVDGVIAINLFVVQKILQALGPVKLTDYQETITADNLFERAEYYSEASFFPGSTQKKDFLTNLTRQLFQEIYQTTNWPKIAQAVFESLQEKQILIFVNDQAVMKKIAGRNWGGSILDNVFCQQQATNSCLADYLFVVESNFGVNKTNYFLKRKLSHKIEIGEAVEEELTIDYQNNSPTQTWPGGTYKNYLRVYTPLNAQLLSVKIDNQALDKQKVDISSSSGKTVFSFLIEVPVKTQRKVVVKYQLPFQTISISTYSFLFQKQSGTGPDPLVTLIKYPASFKLVETPPQALTNTQTILYNTDSSQDRIFVIKFNQ